MNDEHEKQMQLAQDMVNVAINQRNAASNNAIQLEAGLLAAQRRIKELEAKVVALTPKGPAEERRTVPNPDASNGHAEAQA